MRIIGLDLSLTHTGFVVLDKNGKVRAYNTIIPKKLKGVQRLYHIKQKIKRVLRYYKPELAVIEGYAFNPNAGRTFSIGELGGIIRLLLYILDIDYMVVAPKTLKKFVIGGNASKKQIEVAIKKEWEVGFKTEHEYDAFGLAMMGYYIKNKYKCGTERRHEAIETVIIDKSKQNYIKGGKDDKQV